MDIIEGTFNSIIGYHCKEVFYDYCLNVANCLNGLIKVRDNVFAFSGDFHMSIAGHMKIT